MEQPIFTAYLAERTKHLKAFIQEAHELRLKPPVVEARRYLIELEELVENGERRSFVQEANRLRQAINKTAERLRAEYGVETPQGVPLAALTSVLNVPLRLKAGFSLPDFGLKIPLPAGILRLADRHGFKATFRTVVDELVSIERLGILHDIITSAVVRDQEAGFHNMSQIDVRYRGRDPDFIKWM
jgi:hypothetical protein